MLKLVHDASGDDTTGVSLLSEQLYRLLLAIKTGRPGTTWQLGGGVVVEMGKKDWCVAS